MTSNTATRHARVNVSHMFSAVHDKASILPRENYCKTIMVGRLGAVEHAAMIGCRVYWYTVKLKESVIAHIKSMKRE